MITKTRSCPSYTSNGLLPISTVFAVYCKNRDIGLKMWSCNNYTRYSTDTINTIRRTYPKLLVDIFNEFLNEFRREDIMVDSVHTPYVDARRSVIVDNKQVRFRSTPRYAHTKSKTFEYARKEHASQEMKQYNYKAR